MANVLRICVLLTLSLFFLAASSAHARKQGPRDVTESWFKSARHGKENNATIRFYLHDILTGNDASVREVARSTITATSPTGFGQVSVFDDLLTAEPNITSEALGRAQGVVASADFTANAINVNLNVVFTAREYNGSTITIMGRNALQNEVREMSVVGGTGVFRGASGYCLASTYSENADGSYAIREFTLNFNYPRSRY